jgi:RHH-type proline utilization regulon transcriptional repressor/proline dehydrogenase/delta 1-pyrroline-5-carboxylate dehydrogenase
MESLDSLETTLELSSSLLDEEKFADGPSAGLVLQAYLRDSPEELDRIWSGRRVEARAAARHPARQGRVLGPRGDRGQAARLERAGLRGQGASAIATSRAHAPAARRAAGGARRDRFHNLRSVAHALAYAGDTDLEVQVLRGSATTSRTRSQAAGCRVRAYCRSATSWRDGVPRAPPAREHGERVVPARAGARSSRWKSCSPRRESK